MNNEHLQTALLAHKLGFSPVPPKEDGSKAPIGEWKEFQKTPASTQIIRVWYRDGRTGNGLVCGVGNLECFEFDHAGTFNAFLEAAWAIGLGELVNRIRAGYEESTPGGGVHWLYRCDTVGGNTKLACRYKTPEEFTDGDRKAIAKAAAGKEHKPVKTLIETRGKGGYVVTAPSKGKVHPTGGAYEIKSGGLESIVTISPEERDSLWGLARTFDKMPAAEPSRAEPKTSPADGKSPGDDYEERSTWADVLEPFSWEVAHTSGDVTYWRRPGKDQGWSATTGHCKGLKVFSSSTPFSTEGTYTKFGAYTILNHGGDYSAAAKALAEAGYGSPSWAGCGKTPGADGPSSSPVDSSTQASSVGTTESKKKSKLPPCCAGILMRLAGSAKLFHTADNRCFASIEVAGHRENHEIKSTVFRRWLSCRFFKKQRKPPTAEAFQSAISMLEAQATFDGPEEPVYVRVAPGPDGSIYIDLCNAAWNVVKITSGGWEIVADPPVRFIRLKGMLPLPTPERGGSLDDLWGFLNINQNDRLLFIAWLTQALQPVGPYPVLTLDGEAGTAKSTMARIARSVIDPHIAMLRSEPRENRDLMIGACNNWLIALDNLSQLPTWLSDALCGLVTGRALATRALHTDTDEVYLDASRPIIIAAIENVVQKGDLADRQLMITLQPIPEEKRRTEKSLWASFGVAAPGIMGAILDALAAGLKNLPLIMPPRLPRMGDFGLWAEAVCQGIGNEPGAFLALYDSNRQEASEAVLEGSLVAQHLRAWLPGLQKPAWEGIARDLLAILDAAAGEQVVKTKSWPKTPRGLSGALRRLAPDLRKVGVDINFAQKGHDKTRTITIKAAPKVTQPENDREQPSAPSAPSAIGENPSKTEEKSADGQTRQLSADRPQTVRNRPQTVRNIGNRPHSNPEKKRVADDADGADGTFGSGTPVFGYPHSETLDPDEWNKIKHAFDGTNQEGKTP